MSVGITISSYVVANAGINRVHLRALLGAYELVFPIDVAPTPLRDRAWWLSPQSMRVKVRCGVERELGIARPDRTEPVQQNSGAYPRTVWLTLPIQPHQLAVLEDERNGRDIDFVLALLGEGGDGAEVREGFQSELKIAIPRSQWIEQLRSAGALDIILLEIPMPVGSLSQMQAAVAKHLRQAQSHFIDGNYTDCVGACRLALDQSGVTATALNLLGPGRSTMTKSDRGQAMLAAVRHFSHLAHHIGPDTYSRSDAKLVLQITAAFAAADPF
jgi:hypothetical protein